MMKILETVGNGAANAGHYLHPNGAFGATIILSVVSVAVNLGQYLLSSSSQSLAERDHAYAMLNQTKTESNQTDAILTQTVTERDNANSLLNLYQKSLGSLGCTFDRYNPKTSMESTRSCLERIAKIQRQRDQGEAICNKIKEKTTLDLSLDMDERGLNYRIDSYFSGRKATIDAYNEMSKELSKHISDSNGNLRTCLDQKAALQKEYIQNQASLNTCQVEKNQLTKLHDEQERKMNQTKDEFNKHLIDSAANLRTCLDQKGEFHKDYTKAHTSLTTCTAEKNQLDQLYKEHGREQRACQKDKENAEFHKNDFASKYQECTKALANAQKSAGT
jgi:chromosome segregation ATPase